MVLKAFRSSVVLVVMLALASSLGCGEGAAESDAAPELTKEQRQQKERETFEREMNDQ